MLPVSQTLLSSWVCPIHIAAWRVGPGIHVFGPAQACHVELMCFSTKSLYKLYISEYTISQHILAYPRQMVRFYTIHHPARIIAVIVCITSLVVWNIAFICPYIYWEFHHPNWRTPSFFRGVGQPPISNYIIYIYNPYHPYKSPLLMGKSPL